MNPQAANRIPIIRRRILIVDDHPVVRFGLAAVIAREPDLEVCGEAADIRDALLQVQQLRPDVAVVDISLDGENGIELIQTIKAQQPDVRILVSSMHDEDQYAEPSLRAGAMGYLHKRESLAKIVEAVRHILRGELYLSPAISNRLLQRAIGGASSRQDPAERLSPRELEVYQLIGQGLTTHQIADKLALSPKTVETHRKKIKAKLNLPNSSQLSRSAFQWVQAKS